MGDAGAVVSNRDDLAARARLLANHGERTKYEHAIANGRNSRLDALQAAVLRVKLPHLDAWNAARRAVAAHYSAALAGLPLHLPSERSGAECVYHQYVVRTAERARLQRELAERGIGTAVHYPLALHEQEGFRQLGYARGSLPMAERFAAEVLSLPMSPFLTNDAIEYVADSISRFFSGHP
jgi:dTDP-4-amino-4,6-dideoxygalactose transaminase